MLRSSDEREQDNEDDVNYFSPLGNIYLYVADRQFSLSIDQSNGARFQLRSSVYWTLFTTGKKDSQGVTDNGLILKGYTHSAIMGSLTL